MRGTVQLNDISGSGLLMQSVHVLGDQGIHPAPLLQPRQALMRRIGVDVAELMPPCAAAPLQKMNSLMQSDLPDAAVMLLMLPSQLCNMPNAEQPRQDEDKGFRCRNFMRSRASHLQSYAPNSASALAATP